MKQLAMESFETDWGRIHLAASDTGLIRLGLPGSSFAQFEREVVRAFPDVTCNGTSSIIKLARRELLAFLNGKLKDFSVPLDLRVSEFQTQILRLVAQIPYGETRTYSEIAELAGNPKASRAVGTANARNPIPLIIPCHRVVARHGMGGYGGGIEMKLRLLQMEGALLDLTVA